MCDLTILVNSCDKHSEAWPPFFELMKKMWPAAQYPLVLNTETKGFCYPGMEIKVINIPKSKSWSDRLKKVLAAVDTPFVLMFLEDFFLLEPVNDEMFQRCLQHMRENSDIGCISLHNTPEGKVSSTELENFAQLDRNSEYRVNCQIGLWRTEVLRKILRSHESAWDFEVWGSKRSSRMRHKFYSIIPGIPDPFPHDLGKPIYRGRWNMESVNKVREMTGVTFTTDTLQTIPNMQAQKHPQKKRQLSDYIRRIKSMF